MGGWRTLWELRDLISFVALVSVGYVFGRRIEARHFASLRERERVSLGLPVRNFFGGRVSAYESLLDRARREAVLRMKEAAYARGATVILNARLEISSVSGLDAGQRGARSAEVLAYGTALRTR
jgi:uncharacterized protein YbjQ (UPF0145 family)